MGFFRKIGNAFVRFMYGRNGMDQMNLALIWVCLIVDVVAMFAGKASAVAGTILYYAGIILWIWAIFRMLSKNLYKRREENSKYLALTWKIKNSGSGARARHADKDHKYFTCKNCKTICRVPVGKGKIEITCPKCGAKIQGKT
ncbi:MAG: hypothetical protein LKJ86_02585 [Oscillibacter sp.]|jgi:hypothetical protein|nr:hypothetical protein [Oscillibacter sp.]